MGTGRSQPEDRARSARAGFDLHLVKPVGIERLTEVLQEGGAGERRRFSRQIKRWLYGFCKQWSVAGSAFLMVCPESPILVLLHDVKRA